MKKTLFKGCGTALITPMKDDYSVDYDALKLIVEDQIKCGIDAIIVCGTTGEAPTLKISEHLKVVEKVIEYADGKTTVIAGTGSNDTFHSVETAKSAKALGADGALSVTPYYNKTTQEGLYAHYTYIADHTDLPLIVYNVPSRTGVNVAPATYARLAEHPNIVGIKEANGNISSVAETRALCGDKLAVYSGNDDQITPMLSLGCSGVISVLSNILPSETREICTSYFDGDVKRSAELQLKYIPFIKALFCETNPIMIKEAMSIKGCCGNGIRLPLVNPTAAHKELLVSEMKKLGIL